MKDYDNLIHSEYCLVGSAERIRINYVKTPPQSKTSKGTIVLLHGFPQTSYQFRHVIPLFFAAGYDVVAPDYRGAGKSSHPTSADFTKFAMACDIYELLHEHLGVKGKVIMVGHDIGGMVAYAYAAKYTSHVSHLVWGECPLPGTTKWEHDMRNPKQFHFQLHCNPIIAGALVAGRERVYIKHFFEKLTTSGTASAITSEDLDRYVADYSQPGAMECAFKTYGAFEEDARLNKNWWKASGKRLPPTLFLNGDASVEGGVGEAVDQVLAETHHAPGTDARTAFVKHSGHYIAEENPQEFVRLILQFLDG
ncbi:hypothetical protein FH972_023003 [Carpinus fangiana]|uniref:AB hydrolase-1 domain-containing protein n=1 Tax=Carpinus fangiana TaxID=176857 RepID=A0A5N6KU98_9ROSI|nr:hypothetical protein FH972_023003 [Carpinus fangiana]